MKYQRNITLITPCRNEAGIIRSFVKKAKKFASEVLVIDNNSTDASVSIARKAGARVLLEKRQQNGIGYGYAHQTGIMHAKGEYLVGMDADDTYPVEAIPTIVTWMEKHNIDFVSCNRLPLMNTRVISKVRQFGIFLLNLETFILYGYRIQDVLTGMWIMNKGAARSLTLTAGDWNLSPEIKLSAIANPTISFSEYHINHFERKHALSKQNLIQTGIIHAWFILKRRFTTDNPFVSIFNTIRSFTKEQLAYTFNLFI